MATYKSLKYNIGTEISGEIATAAIADNAVTTAKIAADAVTDAKIADDVVGSEHLTAGEVDTTALGADSVTAAKIGDNVIDSEHYAAASIDNEHLADDAVDSDELAAGSVDLAHMSVNSIDSDQYVDGSIDNAHIADAQIDSEHYAAGSIDLEHMSSQSVDEDNLYISNAGSNGQALTKQSGNNGGLTWATIATTLTGIDDQSSSNDDQVTITDTAVVINEDSDDLDFRVESNSYDNCLFVDGGNDRVGVGVSTDTGGLFRVSLGDSGQNSIDATGQAIVIEDDANTGMTILTPTSGMGSINFGDSGDNNIGYIQYDHSNDTMQIGVNASTMLLLASAGGKQITSESAWIFNEAGADLDWRVESSGNAHMLSIDAGNNRVGIGGFPDLAPLHIKTSDSGGSTVNGDADDLLIEHSGSGGMTIYSGTSSEGSIKFGDSGRNDSGIIKYNHSSDSIRMWTNGAEAMVIASAGEVTTPLQPSFRIHQNSSTDYAPGHTMYNQNITEVWDINADMGTNGSFTAPVTGKYLMSMAMYDADASDNEVYDMRLITSNRDYRWGEKNVFKNGYTATTSMKQSGTLIIDMDANDTAYIQVATTNTITNSGNSEHAYYSGHLLG